MNELMQSGYISILSDRCDQLRKEKEELQRRIEKAKYIIVNDTNLNPQRQRQRLIKILEGNEENE
jgi:hypothetical protein